MLGTCILVQKSSCLRSTPERRMDSELLLEKCYCRINRSKLGMKLRYLDRDFGPAAFEHLQQPQSPPRSASFHCTGDSNFMAISSPFVFGQDTWIDQCIFG